MSFDGLGTGGRNRTLSSGCPSLPCVAAAILGLSASQLVMTSSIRSCGRRNWSPSRAAMASTTRLFWMTPRRYSLKRTNCMISPSPWHRPILAVLTVRPCPTLAVCESNGNCLGHTRCIAQSRLAVDWLTLFDVVQQAEIQGFQMIAVRLRWPSLHTEEPDNGRMAVIAAIRMRHQGLEKLWSRGVNVA